MREVSCAMTSMLWTCAIYNSFLVSNELFKQSCGFSCAFWRMFLTYACSYWHGACISMYFLSYGIPFGHVFPLYLNMISSIIHVFCYSFIDACLFCILHLLSWILKTVCETSTLILYWSRLIIDTNAPVISSKWNKKHF